MRSEVDIRNRLNALLVEELDRRVGEAHKKRPHLCVHNYRHPLDERKTVDGEPNENYNRITLKPWEPVGRTVGLCMYGQGNPDGWGGRICEDDLDAQRCPLFDPVHTKENILTEFKEQLSTPGWADENMPGVAELLWVLEETGPLRLPGWKVVWYHWILRIHIRPVNTTVALDFVGPPQLPSGSE